ncbi:MAG: tetratricopeptide repeat protein [bacterium]|nr:tetratricopeptide repeat protein [bacterium]
MATSERVKIDRKALRQPDEFQTLTTQAAAWAQEHQTTLVAVGVALVVLALAAGGIGWWRGRQAEAASIRFRSAHQAFEASRWAEAAEGFASVRADYGSTPYGRLASLYRGHALARAGDAAGAATAYGEYLAAGPETEYLRQEALASLGRAREASGDAAAARDAFDQAAAMPGPFRVEARLGQARLAEAAGDTERVRTIYGEMLAEAPAGPLRAFLEAKAPSGAVPAATPASPPAAPAEAPAAVPPAADAAAQ